MSSIQQEFNAGQNQAHTQAKTEELAQSIKDSANEAEERTAEAAQSASESAQQGKDQTAGFLQQTGEQLKNVAQEAVDTVKGTLGISEQK
ncbi:late embryogenesis abundant protein 1 [Morus notabilis]|uniref:late embryogenesis abundant protein 1 n=1 Tax=Morus notabilis TaxID=981085 RepID=UPI000CED650D|nr:late embryogenesis abundant protein 1 [Morus notabilis]